MVEEAMTSMPDEMFASAVRASGDLAGVFEYDGDTGYFYLYDQSMPGGQRVLDAIHIVSGTPDFSENDVDVRWNADEDAVGFFVCGRLWAAFRRGEKHGGNYRSRGEPRIAESVIASFSAC